MPKPAVQYGFRFAKRRKLINHLFFYFFHV